MKHLSLKIMSLSIFLGLAACLPQEQVKDPASSGMVQGEAAPASDTVTADGKAESADSVSDGGAPMPSSSAPSSSAPSSTGASKPAGGGVGNQIASLTAGLFSDALNIDSFLNFLQAKGGDLQYPANAALRKDLSRDQWLALVPAKVTSPASKLEIALVLDVTGSMGDELSYLQREWTTIISDLKVLYPSVNFRLSLIAYRDLSDNFVTSITDFTVDQTAFQAELGKYQAAGGGDYPEAVDRAFADANKLSWGDATSTKLLFWVADAPPHSQDEAATLNEILSLKSKGVTIYPVAASGVADRAELIMRIGALVSGGSYLFLTDDSGIGNSHAEPHIPCYQVERLNQLLLRVLAEKITGQASPAKPENILRTVGQSKDGVCQIPQPAQ